MNEGDPGAKPSITTIVEGESGIQYRSIKVEHKELGVVDHVVWEEEETQPPTPEESE